ncbi:MAG TPA: M20/M25/M40 family metallo-hydrolase [Thermodesulfobacteriota bacterium]
MQEEVAQELSRLVEIKSESGQEHEVLAYLEHRLESLGFLPFRQNVVEDRYNLIWTPHPHPKVLFSAHVDTVPDYGHPELYAPRVEGDRLYGRGSVDTKAGIAGLILALEIARENGVNVSDCAIAFTVDEEQEGLGSKMLPEAIRADGAIVFEPTELIICPAEAGSIEVRIEIIGTQAHGGDFEAGDNPIMNAISLVESFKDLAFVRDYHPLIGEGGFNIMEIKGGGNALMVPHRCELFVDFRILPGRDAEEAKLELIQLFESKGVKWQFVDIDPPFELEKDAPIVRVMEQSYRKALGKEPKFGAIKSWTDAGNLVVGGIPSIVFGPGKLAVAHTPWEYVELNEVVATTKVIYHIIQALSK